MEKETLIMFMTNLIAFAKVYRGVVKKVADKEYNTHNAYHSLSALIDAYLKDCQEATKPLLESLLESLKAEIEKDVK